jgi:error-prone DNA polymerase
MERHRERLITRMQAKGIAPEFAERVFEQIRGFGEYGFPESHAASFALIAYATAWLRCHYPAEFTCSLLNAQPMGFYMPATIIDDAKRHRVVVRAIDACSSVWDCTLESCAESAGGFAVRVGLRYVKGCSEREAQRVIEARDITPFKTLADFVRRTRLNESMLARFAEAGAFDAFAVSRRAALWNISRLAQSQKESLALERNERAPDFRSLSAFEEVKWDYRTSSHSARRHPLEPIRPHLTANGIPNAHAIARMKHNERIRYAGLVICRQRPGTAGGVIFMTLEDETGFVNVVLWENVFNRYSVLARSVNFLGITGRLQVEDGVVHLVAERLWEPPLELKPSGAGSRDFH